MSTTIPTDPGLDLDAEVQDHRPATEMHRWSLGALGTARTCLDRGDTFGGSIATERAQVYQEASLIVAAEPDTLVAARLLMQRAVAHRVNEPGTKLENYDLMCRSYARARAWQHCARHLDPSLPVVQERWP